ncbi:hypothetical protein C1H57_05170 [Clostridium sp. 2-1]|uniref:DUF4179 domain-containing protein n=1 Tax=Clostridium TaxID=1485 RepID=UPI000CDB68A7|nr:MULTISPECIES: DUF4179 domain-containing protein [Clostridium]MBN7573381.1 DUF4179 domain-containing protein [Clostridium beijerinckii]MBN7578719.1 DUF4179 domain-containing protein [Clostridium beijerinckii]MBN7583154.1 DUF4179 domain-containing protein [Clostridium beijerinckii]MBO0519309.1 DUF4179 domain-containing protein [Clostridium beijerinckii]POO92328.1 hypothetical protein C1H57_05170 [Clostridium sp. 2-1]
MINKKLIKTLGPILGIMTFMLASGITYTSAFADDTIAAMAPATATTTSASATYTDNTATPIKDYSIAINKSSEENGIKVTVNSALATKHNLKVTLKIEGITDPKAIEHNNSLFEVSYGDKDYGFSSTSSRQYADDKTMFLTLEKNNYEGEYPESGNLRVDVVLSNYKVNIGMDVPVDFTNSINKVFTKDITGTIPEINYTLKQLDSDSMGTTVSYTRPKHSGHNIDDNNDFWDSQILLKVDNNFYKLDSRGDSIGDDGTIIGHYSSKLPTYDNIKNGKDISVISMLYKVSMDDSDIISNNSNKNTTTDSANNLSYEKEFSSSSGLKGTIYNVERNDNSVKVYCKGHSELESLIIASNISLNYNHVKGQKDATIYHYNRFVSFYKDPKDSLGYIVEFDNVDKDKAATLNISYMLKEISMYKMGDEIKLSN